MTWWIALQISFATGVLVYIAITVTQILNKLNEHKEQK